MATATVIFVIMALIVEIMLLTAGILSITGGADAQSSSLFNNNSSLRNAYTLLIIAGAILLTMFFVMIIVILIAAGTGTFATGDPVVLGYTKSANVTSEEYKRTYIETSRLEGRDGAQEFVQGSLIVFAIMLLLAVILLVVAAIEIGGVRNPDSRARSALTACIIAVVFAGISLPLLIIAVIAYFKIGSIRVRDVKELTTYQATRQTLPATS